MPKSVRHDSTELVRAMLAAQRLKIVENEEGTRAGTDPEHLHDMRVATRRARAALRTGSGLLEPEQEEKLRTEFAWLGGVLGAVRDLDVLTARLKEESEALDPEEQAAVKAVFGRLAAERRTARTSLTRALKSARYRKLLAELDSAVAGGPVANGHAQLDKRAKKEFGRLVKTMRELGAEPSDEELHRARKLGKRARYATELATPQAAKPTKKFMARARAFQDVTGEHQDAAVAVEKLKELSADAEGPEAFAAGRLAERERERQAAARARLPKAWKDLERAGLRTWS